MPDLSLTSPRAAGVSTRRFVAASRDTTAKIRTAKLEGRDHLVIPVIAAKGDSVIRPLHSTGPELVPAAELQVVPAQWNGRPVVADHPDNGLGSANDPSTLDAYRYGYVFNSRYDTTLDALKQDIYIDVARAKEVGCEWVVEEFKAGRMVEVSVGCWVTLLHDPGTSPSGVEYQYRWSGIIADHLAVGLNGAKGACSVDMGCGALRTAAVDSSGTPHTAAQAPTNGESPMPKSFTDRFAEAFRILAGGKSDIQLREQLSKALRATEPGFEWVVEVFSKRGGGDVVYSTYPGDRAIYYRRSFTLSGDEVSFGDDRVEVEQSVDWKPVTKSAADSETATGEAATTTTTPPAAATPATASPTPTLAAACGCHPNNPAGTDSTSAAAAIPTTSATAEGDAHMPDQAAVTPATPAAKQAAESDTKIKALVGRLIACEASPFAEADRPKLEAWPESTLDDLAKTYEGIQKAKENPAPSPDPAVTAAAQAAAAQGAQAAQAQTVEAWLSTAPAEVRSMFTRFQAAEAQSRANLVAQIAKVPSAASAYPTEVLNKMSTDDLDRLARALGAATRVDHTGRGLVSASVSTSTAAEYPKAPSIYDQPAAKTAVQ